MNEKKTALSVDGRIQRVIRLAFQIPLPYRWSLVGRFWEGIRDAAESHSIRRFHNLSDRTQIRRLAIV